MDFDTRLQLAQANPNQYSRFVAITELAYDFRTAKNPLTALDSLVGLTTTVIGTAKEGTGEL
jgi:hypothetical protein